VRVDVKDTEPHASQASLVCVGLFEGEQLPAALAAAEGAGDAKPGFRKTALLRPGEPGRLLVVGLGQRAEFDAEKARVAAAVAVKQAAALEATSVAWDLPAESGAEVAAALVEGTELASYRFDRFKSRKPDDDPPPRVESLELLTAEDVSAEAEVARVSAEAANRARELQDLPANYKNPTFLAARAEEIAETYDSVTTEVFGRDRIREMDMGGLVAVSQGTDQEPRLMVLSYNGGDDEAETIAWVGKGVTFDSGGISIKPSQKMHEMKMDMSGAAAVLESVAAVAELGLPLNILAVVPSTENMPSGSAIKPGDIITQYNGKTVEVNNTDAEGRLILADALAYAVERGADRIVDLATLTGAVIIALGSTYAALISNDDDWAARVEAAGARSGELAWRLPLHPEYKELTKGQVADLTNASESRKASTIYAASFLEEFVDGKPWVHLDIAGTAWDTGREYVGKGASGYGTRLLVELARSLAEG
jgi:leucyl aminopeptidase